MKIILIKTQKERDVKCNRGARHVGGNRIRCGVSFTGYDHWRCDFSRFRRAMERESAGSKIYLTISGKVKREPCAPFLCSEELFLRSVIPPIQLKISSISKSCKLSDSSRARWPWHKHEGRWRDEDKPRGNLLTALGGIRHKVGVTLI